MTAHFKFVLTVFLFLFALYPVKVLADSPPNKSVTLEHEREGPYKFFRFSTISPNGTHAVLRAFEDGPRKDYFLVFDLVTGKQKCKIPTKMLAPDTVSWDQSGNSVRVFKASPLLYYADLDIAACKSSQLKKYSKSAFSKIDLSRDKQKLLAANLVLTGNSGKIFSPVVGVWDAKSDQLKPIIQIRAHSEEIFDAVFTPDGTKIVTLSADKTARIWDANTGAELHKIKFSHGTPETVTFSPQGHLLAIHTRSWADNRILYLVDPVTGKIKKKIDSNIKADKDDRRFHNLEGPKSGKGFEKVWFSQDGTRLFTQSREITMWEARSGKKIQALDGHTDLIQNPKLAATFASEQWGALYVNDGNSGKLLGKSERDSLPYSNDRRGHMSDDGNRVIVYGDYTVQIWNINDAPCSDNCTLTAYTKPTENENLSLLKRAIGNKDMTKADLALKRLEKQAFQIPEDLHLDYVEFLIFEEDIYFSHEYLKKYRKSHTPQSAHWERALKLETDFFSLIDKKIRYFHRKGDYKQVNSRLDGLPYWTGLSANDYSIIFYEMVQSAIQKGRKDVARTYLETYSKVNRFEKGHALSRHQDLMQVMSFIHN